MLFRNVGYFVVYCVCNALLWNASDAFDLKTLSTLTKVMNLKKNLLKNNNISVVCRQHIYETFFTGKKWSIPMLDAMGKIPAGILEGTVIFFGSYNECLDIVAADENNGTKLFQGQYCKLNLTASFLSTIAGMENKRLPQLHWHGCFPSSCSTSDVVNATRMLFDSLNFRITGSSCEVKKAVLLDNMQIFSLCVFATLAIILMIGTAIDVVSRILKKNAEHHGTKMNVLTSFSLYTNAAKVLSTKTRSNYLQMIDGVRFLSMAWVVLGHTHFIDSKFLGNALTYFDFPKHFLFQIVSNATLAVDVFLVVSGITMTYTSMNVIKAGQSINWLKFYIRRYWRLTPSLVFLILFIFIFPLLGSGPMWEEEWSKILQVCRKRWWAELLYIGNMYDDQCIGVAWYLSLDMQLHIISPLIIYFLWRKPYVGIILNTLCLLATISTTAVLMMQYNSIPAPIPRYMLKFPEIYFRYLVDIYMPIWCRMSSFCNGIFIGYVLSSDRKFKIHDLIRSFLWVISTAVALAIVFSTYYWSNGHDTSKKFNVFYASTNRFFFSLSIAWLIYDCATNSGGIINKILSYPAFIPLSRITYMAYLIHVYIIKFLFYATKERLIYSEFSMVVDYLGVLVIAYLAAFFAHLCFEVPFSNLDRLVFNRYKKEKKEKNEDDFPLLNNKK